MDIEIKQTCKNCSEAISELTISVLCEINLYWNEEEGEYEVQSSNFNLDDVKEYYCPRCFSYNIVNSDDVEIENYTNNEENTVNIQE